jgi:hypothetical protein
MAADISATAKMNKQLAQRGEAFNREAIATAMKNTPAMRPAIDVRMRNMAPTLVGMPNAFCFRAAVAFMLLGPCPSGEVHREIPAPSGFARRFGFSKKGRRGSLPAILVRCRIAHLSI